LVATPQIVNLKLITLMDVGDTIGHDTAHIINSERSAYSLCHYPSGGAENDGHENAGHVSGV